MMYPSSFDDGFDQGLAPDPKEWWVEPEDKKDDQERAARARSLYDQVRALEDSQRSAHEQNLWNARLYSNRELTSFDWGHGVFYNTSLSPVSLLGENLVLSVVDTMDSLVGKNRVKVTPEPHGADFKTRRNARKLDKWLYGEFIRLKVYEKTGDVFKDAAVFGFGCVKVDVRDGKLHVRRVFPDDFIVDQAEATNSDDGQLMHVYERRCRRIEEIEAEYGVPRGDLKATLRGGTNYLPYRQPGRGWAVVVEGYRCARGGVPGRHVVSTDQGILLVDEPWPHEFHPYVYYHANKPLSGFYWPSVVEQVLPYQVRLNEINEIIRDAQDLMARPRILVAEGSRINPADIDNLVGRIIKYTGIKPEALNWEAVSPELYNERDREVRVCFEQFGLPQIVAQGRLPTGARLDSSAALQEATQLPDDRLAKMTQRFEDFHLDLARQMIRVQKERGEDYETIWYSGGRKSRAEVIRWSEIEVALDSYTLTLAAASVFSMTPAARRDKIEGWLAKGVISLEQYWDLDQNPDIESEVSIKRAACDDIGRVIELLEDGDYETPNPMQDLVNGVQRVTLAYLRLSDYEGVPQTVRDNFVKWVAVARAILQQGTQSPDNQGLGGQPATAPAMPGVSPPMPMPAQATY